jgi:hypothetical protein
MNLSMWTLYRRTLDLPQHEIVARRWEIDRDGPWPTNEWQPFETLDAARREMMAKGLTCITRSPSDDPVIVETWL